MDDVVFEVDPVPPDYRALYYQRERDRWEAGTIALAADRRDWSEGRLSEATRQVLLARGASFYVGEERLTDALVPFVDAAPTEEQQVFLTTQLVDEARHVIFFDRVLDEVLGEDGDDMRSRLDRQAERLDPDFKTLVLDLLPEAAAAIRAAPKDLPKLIEGVVIYHAVIVGALVLTEGRFLLHQLEAEDVLPGFRRGLTAVLRDESRHAAFGVRFLKDAVADDGRAADVVRDAVKRFAPIALAALGPRRGAERSTASLPYATEDLRAFALGSLTKRLNVIGVSHDHALA